jgi:hypothetical protein
LSHLSLVFGIWTSNSTGKGRNRDLAISRIQKLWPHSVVERQYPPMDRCKILKTFLIQIPREDSDITSKISIDNFKLFFWTRFPGPNRENNFFSYIPGVSKCGASGVPKYSRY